METYYVYIIYSLVLDKYYIGYTDNLEIRLKQHNSGNSTFTARATDWELRYSESFQNRADAQTRELQIKKKKSRKYIEWLMEQR